MEKIAVTGVTTQRDTTVKMKDLTVLVIPREAEIVESKYAVITRSRTRQVQYLHMIDSTTSTTSEYSFSGVFKQFSVFHSSKSLPKLIKMCN